MAKVKTIELKCHSAVEAEITPLLVDKFKGSFAICLLVGEAIKQANWFLSGGVDSTTFEVPGRFCESGETTTVELSK